MKTTNLLLASLIAASLATGGCAALKAQPETPAVALPGQFHSNVATAGTASATDDVTWWSVLGDATLNALIMRALSDSPDMAMAQARISAARAGLAGARAAGRPQVNAAGSAQRVQQSENGMFGAATQSGAIPDLYSLYSVGADVSWELDLFGAERARRSGARAGVDAAVADADALLLSLPAEIVRVYVEHLVVSRQLASLQRSVQATSQRVALLGERLQQGDASEQEVSAARQEAGRLNARLPLLQSSRDSLRHAMSALLGTTEYIGLPDDSPMLDAAPELLDRAIVAGMPSDLLRRRPDIRGADAEFRRAFAAHQQSVADQYPHFALSASIAQESLQVGDLLKAASLAWHIAGQLVAPLYDGGRRKAATEVQQAQLDMAIAAYRKTVIGALGDVEQSLLARQAAREALAHQAATLAEAQRVLDAEQSRFSAGDTALTQLLQARLAYEDVLAAELQARGDAVLGFVRVQKSLGGPS